jgi:serine/threonine-protein kinase
LQHQLNCGIRFDFAKTISILKQLLAALDYSHSHEVIHRDIKPANIMFTASNQVKVADFGVAKIDSTHMTRSGYVVGSPEYMSPEQFTGQHIDKRTDIFSAGVIFYQLLTGIKPFTGSDLGAVLHNILHSIPDIPSSLNSQVPVEINAVVMKAICKNVEQRYQSAQEFSDAIQKVVRRLAQKENSSVDWEETLVIPRDVETTTDTPTLPTENSVTDGDANDKQNTRSATWPTLLKTTFGVFVVGFLVFYLIVSWRSETNLLPVSTQLETALPFVDEGLLVSTVNATDIEILLATYDCADIDVKIENNQVILSGHVASIRDLQKLKANINLLPGLQELVYDVQVQKWPYCELLTTLRPFANSDSEEKTVFSASSDVLRFTEGSNLQFDLVTPSFPAYMYVDYFLLDGTVVHLLPNSVEQDNKTEPHKTIHLGGVDTGGRQWTITAPFGREMITVIVAKEPLFSAPRPEIEDAKEYLAVLQSVIVARDQSTVAASHTYIYTHSK